MKNFDRQYRLAAGKAGSTGFEIGSGKRPLHVSFSVEKADTNSQNTAKVTIWNLSDEHLAELSKNDCVVVLHAGYGDTRPLIFTGVVTFATTKADGADRSTEIELVDKPHRSPRHLRFRQLFRGCELQNPDSGHRRSDGRDGIFLLQRRVQGHPQWIQLRWPSQKCADESL